MPTPTKDAGQGAHIPGSHEPSPTLGALVRKRGKAILDRTDTQHTILPSLLLYSE